MYLVGVRRVIVAIIGEGKLRVEPRHENDFQHYYITESEASSFTGSLFEDEVFVKQTNTMLNV